MTIYGPWVKGILLDIFNLCTVGLDLNRLVLNSLCILTFGLSNFNSFGDQSFVAMATIAYEFHSQRCIMLRRSKRSTAVTPIFFTGIVLQST